HQHSRRAKSSALWDLMAAIGRICVGLMMAVALIVALRRCRPISKRLAHLLPEPVSEFFTDSTPRRNFGMANSSDSVLNRLDKKLAAKETLGETADRPQRYIKLGSTKKDVLAIQGTPTRSTEGTWYYGDSEIYFAGNVVVSWRSSNRNPLRVQ